MCGARRMVESAAHLANHVIPEAPAASPIKRIKVDSSVSGPFIVKFPLR